METSLPPGKELSVRLSIVRPLKIESFGAIFLFLGVITWKTNPVCVSFFVIRC